VRLSQILAVNMLTFVESVSFIAIQILGLTAVARI
jgi:hypothetical protein